MTHELRQRHPLNAIGPNPLVATLRYRCTCATNEVLTISVVIDIDADEERFIWTMRRLWHDVKFEVETHLNPPATASSAGPSPSAQPPQPA